VLRFVLVGVADFSRHCGRFLLYRGSVVYFCLFSFVVFCCLFWFSRKIGNCFDCCKCFSYFVNFLECIYLKKKKKREGNLTLDPRTTTFFDMPHLNFKTSYFEPQNFQFLSLLDPFVRF
jgi:hypothetical protein